MPSKRRRLVHAAHQIAQTLGEDAAFLLGEETANLESSAATLDQQSARIEARARTAKSNLRPMPRKLLFCFAPPRTGHEADLRVGNGYRLRVRAALQVGTQGYPQGQHFERPERQHRPKAHHHKYHAKSQ